MDAERWEHVAELHRAALEREKSQRAAFLAEACAGDDELRREVESLLAEESQAESFMEKPAMEVAARALAVEPGFSPAGAGLKAGATIGAMLSHYQIMEKLGAGGMGEVYRARDTKLNRDVALKFVNVGAGLAPPWAPQGAPLQALDRFRREARMLAALNHPNIAAIYGLEESGGAPALVMELVEGPTLADRLRPASVGAGLAPPSGKGAPRGAPTHAIPLDESLNLAKQMAEALEYAHERGIIHRDLKPANIKVKADGAVKVLDFGLAKALDVGADSVRPGSAGLPSGEGERSSPLQDSPTISAVTEPGMIIGTAAYMSPEQASGKPVDRRTDIWAFGCVLYEMLTGRKAFAGETMTETLAAVLKTEPDWTALAADTPIAIQKLIRRCLQKDPRQRLQAIGDARITIEETLASGDSVAAVSDRRTDGKIGDQRSPLQRALPWALGALGIATAVVLAAVAARYMRQPQENQAITFLVHPPSFTASFYGAAPVLSPDGRKLVFIASGPAAEHVLWIRSLDDPVAKPLPGTENALSAFWSPDSRHLGFVTVDGIKRVDPQGGPVTVLSSASPYEDATWSRNGVILFPVPPWVDGRIYRITDSGGQATPVTTPDPSRHEVSHNWPRFLPDGMHFLYAAYNHAHPEGNWVCVGTLDSKKTNCLVKADSSALYAPEGYLLYLRGETLVAQPFDAKRLVLTGDPVPIAQPVDPYSVSLSDTGLLAYQQHRASAISYEGGRSPSVGQQLTWFDRAGKKLGNVGPLGSYSNPALSPDATKLAVDVRDPEIKTRDIWVFDLKRATASRLNSNPADDFDPVWSADGTRIFFTSDRNGQRNFYQKSADGLGESEVVFLSPDFKSTLDLSSDGRYLLFNRFSGSEPLNGLWILPQFGSRQPASFIGGKGDPAAGYFSPDGRYLAYVSNETGRREVYVQSFPEHRAKLQISAEGGDEPAWRRDGKELFYLADYKIMAVSVKAEASTFQAGIPRPLFEAPVTPFKLRNRCVVTPDGQRFLCIVPERQETPPPITVVVNWPALLKNSGK